MCRPTGVSQLPLCPLQVNNAGIAGHHKRESTKDGLEVTMATNYYGHFLLTNLLLGKEKIITNVEVVLEMCYLFV